MSVSRLDKGLSTDSPTGNLAQFIAPDPTKAHVFFDDFDRYVAADWTITTTETGTGSASEALADEDGGVLLLTNAQGDNDNDFIQKNGESFLMESGKKAWFKSRLKVSDATQSDFVMGLQITDTSPLDTTDGIFFQKDDGDTNLDFHVEKDDTASSATAVATVADDTYLDVGFYYNGVDEVEYFVNNVKQGHLAVTNLPDDEELTVSFGIQNGDTTSTSMSIDYIFAAKER